MNLMISEIQITFVILMGLVTLFLAVAIPYYAVVGKEYNCARKLLAGGTFLVTVHFLLQYLLQKQASDDIVIIRSVMNLAFGILVSYLFNISNYYLQRKGKVRLFDWLLAPGIFILSLLVLLVCGLCGNLGLAALVMSFLYAGILFYYGVIQIIGYLRINDGINRKDGLLLYVKWTRWSFLVLFVITLGFPIMTFNTNLMARSLYGILSISSAFFYILCFLGYGLSGTADDGFVAENGLNRAGSFVLLDSEDNLFDENEEDDQQDGLVLKHKSFKVDEVKLERVRVLVDDFVKRGVYLRKGLTMQDAAIEMGVSVYWLRCWLQTTEYKKYSNWIVLLRLEMAKKMLLKHPELSNEEVAERCGFCDRQYFQRSFRKWVGMSPIQWSKQAFQSSSLSEGDSSK